MYCTGDMLKSQLRRIHHIVAIKPMENCVKSYENSSV
jgi:hypothetical protein